jgi:antitoxin FitA
MAMTTVRLELDERLFDKIVQKATAKNQSIEDHILSLLNEAMIDRRKALIERIDAIAAMTPKGVEQTDSTLLIREDRDR